MSQVRKLRRVQTAWHFLGGHIALILLFTGTNLAHAFPFTPPEWQQKVEKHAFKALVGQRKHISWARDRNRNFIDDQIEKSYKTGDTVDVIVALNSFVPYRNILELFKKYGKIRYVSKLVTFFFLDGIRYENLQDISCIPQVAMIELQEVFRLATDVSVRAVQSRRSATYSPNTAEDVRLSGSRVNIAIMDTGVDDQHEQLVGSYRFGFNALIFEDANMNGRDDSCEPPPIGNGSCMDPDDESGDGSANPVDEVGHGTLVAGIALGRGAERRSCSSPDDGSMPCTCAGVAPRAGLVDIKVCYSYNCPPIDVAEALDWLGLKSEEFDVRVANMSFASCTNDDGTSAMAQQVNQLADLGVVMVLAHGNSGNCYPYTKPGDYLTGSPGSASSAVTVAGSNDKETVTRTDDDHYVGYLRGPRVDFNLVSPDLMALKPDIAAPAQKIFSAQHGSNDRYQKNSGTSFAAPHVSGTAALMLEKWPSMDPHQIKDLLKRSADTSRNVAEYPMVDPTWDSAFGSGLLNIWPALQSGL